MRLGREGIQRCNVLCQNGGDSLARTAPGREAVKHNNLVILNSLLEGLVPVCDVSTMSAQWRGRKHGPGGGSGKLVCDCETSRTMGLPTTGGCGQSFSIT